MNLAKIFGACLVGLSLAACNGNDNDEITTTGGVTSTSSVVAISPDTGALTLAAIRTLSTTAGQSALGQAVPTHVGESIVLALDENSHIRMAGFAEGNTPSTLSTESTAMALVRLAIDTPGGASRKTLNGRIKETASFPQLVEYIKSSLEKGESPQTSADVMKTVLLVVRETISDSIDGAAPGKSYASLKSLSLDNVVKSPYPFLVVPNANALGSVNLSTDRRISNSMPIAWSVSSRDHEGNEIAVDEKTKHQILEAASPLSRLASGVSDWGTAGAIADFVFSNAVTAPDDKGKSFTLVVEQTSETNIINLEDIIISVAREVIPYAESEDCYKTLAEHFIPADKLSLLAGAPTMDNFMNFLGSTAVMEPLKTAVLNPKSNDFSQHCLKSVQPDLFQASAKFLEARIAFLIPLSKAVEKAVSYSSIAEKMWMTGRYWDDSFSYTVCMSKPGVLQGGQVTNCAVRFEVPGNVVMTPGAQYYPDIKAFDAGNNQTLLPASLRVLSAQPDKLSVDANGQLTALTVGAPPAIAAEIKLTASDTTTGKTSDPVSVFVVAPRFNKSEVTLKKGGSVMLKLKDSEGREITHNGKLRWESSPVGIVDILPGGFPVVGNESTFTDIQLRGLKDGTATVIGVNLTDGSTTEPLKVKVEGDYAIEVADVDSRADVYDCRTVLNGTWGAKSYVACDIGIDVKVRCTGADCEEGRFFVAVKSMQWVRNFLGTSNQECADIYRSDLMLDKVPTASVYQSGSGTPWVALKPETFVTPWQRTMGWDPVRPAAGIFRDLVMYSGYTNEDCLTESASQKIVFRVYDAVTGSYLDVPYSTQVP